VNHSGSEMEKVREKEGRDRLRKMSGDYDVTREHKRTLIKKSPSRIRNGGGKNARGQGKRGFRLFKGRTG